MAIKSNMLWKWKERIKKNYTYCEQHLKQKNKPKTGNKTNVHYNKKENFLYK